LEEITQIKKRLSNLIQENKLILYLLLGFRRKDDASSNNNRAAIEAVNGVYSYTTACSEK